MNDQEEEDHFNVSTVYSYFIKIQYTPLQFRHFTPIF